jgi:hypothetical protein
MPELFNPASIFVSVQKVWIPAFAGMTPLPMIHFNVVEIRGKWQNGGGIPAGRGYSLGG